MNAFIRESNRVSPTHRIYTRTQPTTPPHYSLPLQPLHSIRPSQPYTRAHSHLPHLTLCIRLRQCASLRASAFAHLNCAPFYALLRFCVSRIEPIFRFIHEFDLHTHPYFIAPAVRLLALLRASPASSCALHAYSRPWANIARSTHSRSLRAPSPTYTPLTPLHARVTCAHVDDCILC